MKKNVDDTVRKYINMKGLRKKSDEDLINLYFRTDKKVSDANKQLKNTSILETTELYISVIIATELLEALLDAIEEILDERVNGKKRKNRVNIKEWIQEHNPEEPETVV